MTTDSATASSRTTWSLDREIVLTRVFDAPVDAVWAAWVGDGISEWFGPEGFVCTTFERDVRVGGVWRFEFVGPDGTVYPNHVTYLELDEPRRIVFDHGASADDEGAFRVTLTFDQQSDGKTVFSLRQLHPTVEQRDGAVGFGAVELGYQTLAKLAAFLGVD